MPVLTPLSEANFEPRKPMLAWSSKKNTPNTSIQAHTKVFLFHIGTVLESFLHCFSVGWVSFCFIQAQYSCLYIAFRIQFTLVIVISSYL